EVEAYEQRKLWMLNGSHSLMAYAGPILGVETVAEGIAHPRLREIVQTWWQEAGPGLSVPWEDYAQALIDRYENPNIRHLLAQIAADGSQKIPVRIAPTLRRFRKEGEMPKAAVTAVAAWLLHLRGHGAPIKEAAPEKLQALVGGSLKEDAKNVLGHVVPELAGDDELVTAVMQAAEELLA
ncbi:MAG: mannitol dehydrogenase family protein, partial [Propionibacterium sp.]|nr:mannitol dehydrogenase family protein [Propionibacterium sp.]